MPDFREVKLPNGLRIAAEVDQRGYSAALGYFVRAGSRDEVDSESGLSHFLEHMMFKGTARRTAADVNRELDELGGQGNAYTSEEQTVYYAAVLPKFQDRIVDLLTDMLAPKLDAGEFETERQVILEEIAKYEDQPPFGAFERAMELYFGPRGLGRRVLGTDDSIGAMSAERMRDYFCRRYRPENIVLAATGNIDFDGLVDQVSRLTETWDARPVPSPPPEDDLLSLPQGVDLEAKIAIPDVQQSYFVRIGKGSSESSADRYAARMLSSVLGDEGGSRMFWELIDTGRAEVATVWSHEFTDCGAWFTYMVCAPEDAAINLKLIDQILERTARDGIEEKELAQAINKAAAGCIMQSERPSNRLFGVGSRWLTRGEYVSTDEKLDRIRSLTVAEVSAAAQTYLQDPSIEVVAAAAPSDASPATSST